jgi:predicted metalloprotease with PDZ domain
MKKSLFILFLVQSAILFAQKSTDKLLYKVNLNEVVNDELTIELTVPQLSVDKISFHLPKMVPGTYSIYDFGRFVTDMKVLDANGNGLDFKRTDDNSWEILDAKKLHKILYKVEDTWDTGKDNVVFEPAGTNIDAAKVFVFNNHGIFGFFKGMERNPMRIEIDRPKNLFAGTALKRVSGDEDTDVFEVSDYHLLVDSPIMFAEPDTAIIQVGNATVMIHTYSPTQKVKSKDLVADIFPILDAQKDYLGGKLPVDNYAFIIFLNKGGQMFKSGSAGALEHSYSSFYCLFEGEPESIAQTVRDVAAHEFFHIVTPLSIHSEEIHYFDFIDPKMSQHLWLYEGVTEYSAQHVQVKQGLVSVERFLNQMSQKLATSDYFKNDISFTEMSKTCLQENKDQYSNVYMKGALIGMCVDLKLRILSGGKYGIQNLMVDLSKKYGINKPFKDDELFDEMAAVSGYKEIKDFMLRFVAGTEMLPIAELMKEAGIQYSDNGFVEEISMFGFNPSGGIGFDRKTSRLKIASESAIDEFGKKDLGLKEGDIIKEWDGEDLNLMNVQALLGGYAAKAAEGYELKITVLREKELPAKEMKKRQRLIKKGKTVEDLPLEEVNMNAKLRKIKTPQKHAFNLDDSATAQQVNIRKSWLGAYKLEADIKK